MDSLAQSQRVIKEALMRGEVITTSSGNRMAKTTETRKIISRLRHSGMSISDRWMELDGRRWKEYWCPQVKRSWISRIFHSKTK